jgi:hypothetical protein
MSGNLSLNTSFAFFVYPDILSERSESKDLSGRLCVRLLNQASRTDLMLSVV